MKRFFVLVALVGGLFVTTSHVSAAQFRANDTINISASETIGDDLYISGGDVTVDGTVTGDVIAAGGQVTLNGTVTGDVIGAGGQVTLNGTVNDDVRAASGQLTINGQVGGDLIAAGGNVDIEKNASIGGLTQAFAGQLTIAGKTNRVNAAVGTLNVQSSASINGDLVYTSDEEATIQNGSTITGAVTHKPVPVNEDWKMDATKGIIYSLITSAILAYLFSWAFPHKTGRLTDEYQSKFLPNLLWGFLFLIAAPILAVIFFVTIIGVPLGLATLLLYPIFMGLGKLVSILGVGTWLESLWNKGETKQPSILAALVGALALSLVGLIPIIGWFVVFIAFLSGLGVLIRYDWNLLAELRAKKQL